MKKTRLRFISLFAAAAVIVSSMPYLVSSASATSTCATTNVNIQYYFPRAGQNAKAQLLSVINSAKSSLDIAIYSFTETDISNAILKAKQRHVAVKVIVDKAQAAGKTEKALLSKIKSAKIPVKVNNHPGTMQLKITVADKKIVTTGSFDYTKDAQNSNDEVFIVINNQKVSTDFDREFLSMWNDSKKFANL